MIIFDKVYQNKVSDSKNFIIYSAINYSLENGMINFLLAHYLMTNFH